MTLLQPGPSVANFIDELGDSRAEPRSDSRPGPFSKLAGLGPLSDDSRAEPRSDSGPSPFSKIAASPGMEATEGTGAAVAAAHAAAPGANASSVPLPQCKALRHEVVEKPTKYMVNTDTWQPWAKSFKKFLRKTNAQWPKIF